MDFIYCVFGDFEQSTNISHDEGKKSINWNRILWKWSLNFMAATKSCVGQVLQHHEIMKSKDFEQSLLDDSKEIVLASMILWY